MKHYCWYFLWFLILLLGVACNKATQSISNKTNSPSSSYSQLSEEYKGYRLAYVNITSNGKNSIRGTLINTGRHKVIFPLKSATPIVINFDHTLEEQGVSNHSKQIQEAILRQSFVLEPGQIDSNFSVDIEKGIQENAPEIKPNPEEVLVERGGDFQDYCPDLQIDTFFVSKRTKKYAEISFKIVNVGKGPAELFGESRDVEDNVAIRAYASGTENLSRGDLIIGGAYIESGLEDKAGILQPSESFAGAFRVDIRKKTRHMPYLIISIDDYQKLWECDEKNNVKNLLYR